MAINIIVAADQRNGIGCHGQMPWHLPGDLKHFRDVTMGHPVIMGSKTWAAIGKKPLPGRVNIVVSHNTIGFVKCGNVMFCKSVRDAICLARIINDNIFIIGGGSIYKQTLPFADRVFLTRVHTEAQDADTFFPELDPAKWRFVRKSRTQHDDKSGLDYTFLTYWRIHENE